MERRRFLWLGCAGLLAAAGVARRPAQEAATPTPRAAPVYLSSPMPPAPFSVTTTPADSTPLSSQQREALRLAAAKRIAETPEAAQQMARSLHFIDGESETPDNMDGPLALQMLIDAGLLDLGALFEQLGYPQTPIIKSLWKANPADLDQRKTFEQVFPHATHELVIYEGPAAKIDFIRRPLFPGDFVYAMGRKPGRDRAFLVTEVDAGGRAWTVVGLPQGINAPYIVRRAMLYDPGAPGEGQIYTWANPALAPYDQTGDGGLAVFRFKSQADCPGEASCTTLEKTLNRYLNQSGGVWHILVRDLEQGDLYRRGGMLDAIHPASMIKLALAMLFLKWMEATGTPDPMVDEEMLETGLSYRQVLYEMMVISNEDAAGQVTQFLFKEMGKAAIRETLCLWGAYSTEIEPRSTNMGNMAALMSGLWQGSALNPAHTQWVLDWMHTVTPGDKGRIWTLAQALPAGTVDIWNKRGSIAEASSDGTGLSIVADVGMARIHEGRIGQKAREVLIFIHGVPDKGLAPMPYQETYEALEQTSDGFMQALASGAGW